MKSIVVGTAGHIDHGKSALVHALTGTDPDRLKEEKARGITIDLGFAHTVIGGVNFAFVDVPGHERFVKNMLAGIGGIDLVVLVVAADESVMPQTREHFDICRLLCIPTGVVAITKSDLIDGDTLELVRLEVRELVADTFLGAAPIVAVSSRAGEGLDRLRDALVEAAGAVAGRSSSGVARLPIDRVFSMKGFGTVITGTLVSGRVAVDDELQIAPGERRVKVRGVQVHGTRQPAAEAGQRSALNLAGVEVADVTRGQVLITPGALEETTRADTILELLASARPLKHGTRVRFHQGTAEILGRVAIVGPIEDRDGREAASGKGSALQIAPGSRAFVRLRLERPAVLTRGDRFILRAYSPPVTIAGGQVLDPRPPRTAIRSQSALDRLRLLDIPPADAKTANLRALEAMVSGAGQAGLSAAALVSRAGLPPADARSATDALAARAGIARVGDVLVAPAIVDRLSASVIEALRAHHAASPLSDGMPREEVRERLFAHGNPGVFDKTIDDLIKAGRIAGRERLALAGHRVALSPEEERARAAIERAYREGGLTPPDVAMVIAKAGVSPATGQKMLQLLQRQKTLVKVDTLLFHDEALKGLKRDVTSIKASAGADARIDVATFKERFGVSRKFAIPLLEYLDRERVTRRMGDARVVL